MLDRLFPRQIDNRYDGYRAALWLLGLLTALKLVVATNSIVNTASVAAGADGIPLDSFGPEAARAVLMLFSLSALGDLILALIGVAALIRYRAMVPVLYLMSIGEYVAQRVIVANHAVARSGGISFASSIPWAVLGLLTLGLVLSLMPARRESRSGMP